MENKSLKEMYAEAKAQPTEAQKFVQRVCDTTGLTYESIRNWFTGKAKPSKAVRYLLEMEFKTPWQVLFPDIQSEDESTNH